MPPRKKVLIVEDTEMIRATLIGLLKRYDCDVLEAGDGRAGLERAIADRPDLILLDISMPEMDGTEMLQRVRANPDIGDTPVVMMTGVAEREVVLSVAKAGVRGYLLKPVQPAQFEAVVSQVLGAPRDKNAA